LEEYPILGLSHIHLKKDKISNIQDRGMQVFAWTVDEPDDMEKLLAWGVDGIITNHPDRLLQVMKKKFP